MVKRKRELLPDDLDAFSSQFDKDSDRASALVAAALLDAQLEDLFRHRLKHNQERLLGVDGPLATFANRTRFARALEWIDADVEADLNIIRDVRNRFAHSFDRELAFTDPQIEGWCTSIRTIGAYFAGYDEAKAQLHRNFSLSLIAAWRAILESPRARFLATTHFIAQHLREITESGKSNHSSRFS